MTNPAIAFNTYFLEMIIAYMFFSRISVRKHSVAVSLGLGSLIFGIGAAINLLFKNDLLVNSFLMLTMHVLFVSLCFFLKLQPNVFYTVILSALCAALEVAPILLMSVLTGGRPVDHENNMLLFAFDFTISKSLYLISCLLLSNAISKISKSKAADSRSQPKHPKNGPGYRTCFRHGKSSGIDNGQLYGQGIIRNRPCECRFCEQLKALRDFGFRQAVL